MNWFDEYSKMNNTNLCNMPGEDSMCSCQAMPEQIMDGTNPMYMPNQMMWGTNPMYMPGQMSCNTNAMFMPNQMGANPDPMFMPGQIWGGFNPFFPTFGFFPFGFFFPFPHNRPDYDEYSSNVYPYISPLS